MTIAELEHMDVIHCPIYEEALQILKMADSQGYKWCYGKSFLEDINWIKYQGETCYNIRRGEYCNKAYYLKGKYRIFEAKDFLEPTVQDTISSLLIF